MKKLLVLLALLLLPLSAMAEQDRGAYYQYLSEGMIQALDEAYGEYAVPAGTSIDPDNESKLLILDLAGGDMAVILEETAEGRYEVSATNEMILPDYGFLDAQWWIQDKWGEGTPYLWYQPKNGEDEMYLMLAQDDEGLWYVASGHFQPENDDEGFLGFELANQGTAFRVSVGGYFNAVYVPVAVDLAFSAFDPVTVKAYCAYAATREDEPNLIPSTMEADALPQGQVIELAKGAEYPVYSGPGTDYARARGDDFVSSAATAWVQVFGQEDGWLLIQYPAPGGEHRFGYIAADALPEGVTVPVLAFAQKEGMVEGWATDAPLRSFSDMNLEGPAKCVQLATMGSEWRYIEVGGEGQPKMRCFVSNVELREAYEGFATVQAEKAPFYADASEANQLGTYYAGLELSVLSKQDGFARVRIGGENAWQEGYIRIADLVMSALPGEVEAESLLVDFLVGEGVGQHGFVAPSMDAQRVETDTVTSFQMLGEINGFAHLSIYSMYDLRHLFVPLNWVTPYPFSPGGGALGATVVLTENSPTFIQPDDGMPSEITLYKGMVLDCVELDGWYFVSDSSLELSSSYFTHLGYLPESICSVETEKTPLLPVGVLTPAQGAGARSMHPVENGYWGMYEDSRWGTDGFYGWGTRMIIAGETESWYLVRTPIGKYGFIDKEDITLSGDSRGLDAYASLAYGITTLSQASSCFETPYADESRRDYYPAGTEAILMSNLGDWWGVSLDGQVGFLPREVLNDVPLNTPVYEGPSSSFRILSLGMRKGAFTPTENAWRAVQ